MFLGFFYALRNQGIPASLHEYLTLMQALKDGLASERVDDFYALSKTVFVKDQAHLDRFDKVFGEFFRGVQFISDDLLTQQIPADWLEQFLKREISEEERAAIEKMGGLDALMERFKELLEEQKERHNGGNKWIGAGGTSPFGHSGHNPEGFRVGGESKNKSAIKVWQKRQYKDLDDRVELNTRNIKMILKRLRILTREGVQDELDLDDTIRRTSENAGMLDISMRPERKNRVKILMLMDIGGSMDSHIKLCEELFSAAKWQFKDLKFHYFHNCVYEGVWKDNSRRWDDKIPTLELINKYGRDYRLIIVGDAAMSPFEIFYKGGSVEHYNDEPGIVWLRRLRAHFKHMAWINPMPDYEWDYYESVAHLRKFSQNRMFPMTLEGLTKAMKCLKNPKFTWDNKIWEE